MADSFDCIIIGAGPAGLSAAAEIGRSGLTCLALDKLGPGGELINLGALHGCAEAAPAETGPELAARLTEAAMTAGVEIGFGEVRRVSGGPPWQVETGEDNFAARAIVVATGLSKGTTGLPEEHLFAGRGLSHCAHCDGPLYRGQPVAVLGGGEWAAQEAIDLAGMAGHVTLVRPPGGAALSRDRQQQLAGLANVAALTGQIVRIGGSDGLEAITLAESDGERDIPARGLFVYAGRTSALEVLAHLFAATSGKRLVTEDGRTLWPRILAAGDVIAPAHETVSRAIADGIRAGQNVVELLRAAG
jgi:thioredoxin reductase (NADPH)